MRLGNVGLNRNVIFSPVSRFGSPADFVSLVSSSGPASLLAIKFTPNKSTHIYLISITSALEIADMGFSVVPAGQSNSKGLCFPSIAPSTEQDLSNCASSAAR